MLNRSRKIYQQVFMALSIVGATLPAFAKDSSNLFSTVYVDSKDLRCIHQKAAPHMEQSGGWKRALEQAIDACITWQLSSVLRFESFRIQLRNQGRFSVMSVDPVNEVRRRYAVTYLFLYNYCPKPAVSNCILAEGFNSSTARHEAIDLQK